MISIGQTVFELESGNENVDGQMDGQTKRRKNTQKKNRQNYTNFERNLAMMVIYVPVKFEFDWTNRFQVRVRKQKCGRTDGWTNEWTDLNQLIYVPVKYEFDWTKRFRVRVRNQKCGQTDGQKMDKRTDGITPISKGT